MTYDDAVNAPLPNLPVSPEGSLRVLSASSGETLWLGTLLAPLLGPGDVLPLWGGFGVGKTTFVQGIGEGLRVAQPVVSPSFGLVHEYTGHRSSLRLYHLDLYRIQSVEEAEGLGLEEILGGEGTALVEWPQVIESVLPEERLDVLFEAVSEDHRELRFEPHGARARDLLGAYRSLVGLP
ncbi:MAG: tRNA (adenosine(37)-N6)-threonylcarbamoyltransferase complex ATPase subunit type 1 TsaE [Chloroflexota bacterium]|nr:tRNA (adenosine(37)-N6)-threonylcarbamoyltransferase complex ATPase subunit type 1 TsaE [Chloroflexota bacterium]